MISTATFCAHFTIANKGQEGFACVSQITFFFGEFLAPTQNLEVPGQLIWWCFTSEVSLHWRCKIPGRIRAHFIMHNMLLSFNLAGDESPSLVTEINNTAGSGILSPLMTQMCLSPSLLFSLCSGQQATPKSRVDLLLSSSLIRGEFKSVGWEFLQ